MTRFPNIARDVEMLAGARGCMLAWIAVLEVGKPRNEGRRDGEYHLLRSRRGSQDRRRLQSIQPPPQARL